MKYFFIVQGEGMGHTTQSLALRSMLERRGHEVTKTWVGSNLFRRKNKLLGSVEHSVFFSPVFLASRDGRGINLFLTFLYNLVLSPVYILMIFGIAFRIRTSDADAVIVFYDFVGQLGAYLSFSGKPIYSISHHFFFTHSSFRFPDDRKAGQYLLRIHSYLASLGATKKLALSFTQERSIPEKRLYVVPPLLRDTILKARVTKADHVHIYILFPGFLEPLTGLANRFPERKFRVFLNKWKEVHDLPLNLEVFPVSEEIFYESLRTSEMIICTAGFESLAEAVFLNKPLIIVPSGGHFEQYCNSLDASRVKVARVEKDFFFEHLDGIAGNPAHPDFIKWVSLAEEIFAEILTD